MLQIAWHLQVEYRGSARGRRITGLDEVDHAVKPEVAGDRIMKNHRIDHVNPPIGRSKHPRNQYQPIICRRRDSAQRSSTVIWNKKNIKVTFKQKKFIIIQKKKTYWLFFYVVFFLDKKTSLLLVKHFEWTYLRKFDKSFFSFLV